VGGLEAIADTVMEPLLSCGFRATIISALPRAMGDRHQRMGCVGVFCHAVAGVNWLDRLAHIKCPDFDLGRRLDVGGAGGTVRSDEVNRRLEIGW
jgi:hypothetical protein